MRFRMNPCEYMGIPPEAVLRERYMTQFDPERPASDMGPRGGGPVDAPPPGNGNGDENGGGGLMRFALPVAAIAAGYFMLKG